MAQSGKARVLTNTLISMAGDGYAPQAIVGQALDTLRQARIPGTTEGSSAILPLSQSPAA